jgi:hypothetical protein
MIATQSISTNKTPISLKVSNIIHHADMTFGQVTLSKYKSNFPDRLPPITTVNNDLGNRL